MTIAEQLFKEGMEKGIEQGIEKGIEKGKLEVAQKMLLNGMSIDLVQRVTELPLEAIRRLQQGDEN